MVLARSIASKDSELWLTVFRLRFMGVFRYGIMLATMHFKGCHRQLVQHYFSFERFMASARLEARIVKVRTRLCRFLTITSDSKFGVVTLISKNRLIGKGYEKV